MESMALEPLLPKPDEMLEAAGTPGEAPDWTGGSELSSTKLAVSGTLCTPERGKLNTLDESALTQSSSSW